MPLVKPLLQLGRLGATAIGGALGAATAEPDENPLLRGLGGAALGGVVGPAALGAAARGYRKGGGGKIGVADALSEWTYFNFLGSPDTMLRASSGGIGGALVGALEDMTEGVLRFDPELLKRSGRILKGLTGPGKDEGLRLWLRTIGQSPEDFTRAVQKLDPTLADLEPEQYMRGESMLGRFFSASDMVANKALQAGGRAPRESARYTLTGQGKTPLVRSILEKQKEWREGGMGSRLFASQMMPFARVALLSGEKALEHTPLLGTGMHRLYRRLDEEPILKNIEKLRDQLADVVGPRGGGYEERINEKLAKELEALAKIRADHPSALRQGIQQGLGVGAYLGGKEAEQRIDPRIAAVFAPIAGPAYIPFRLGQEMTRASQRDEDPSMWDVVGETLKDVSPLGHRPTAILESPQAEFARRLIPSGAADIAEAIDPAFTRAAGPVDVRQAVERGEISMPLLGLSPAAVAATARIPWLREQLPEEFAPTDIFGDPRYKWDDALTGVKAAVFGDPGPASERNDILRGISRSVFPSRATLAPPVLNQLDPDQAIFRELGLSPGAPSTRVNLPGLGVPLQHTAQSAAAVARHRGLARQMTARILSNMPAIQNMAEGPRKQLLVRRIAELVQSRLSQALSAGTLPIALSQGAQLPGWLQRPL